jgi:O-antigen ligase
MRVKALLSILVSALFVGALLQHSNYWELGIGLKICASLLLYLLFSTGESTSQNSFFLTLTTILFIYTILTSNLVSRSALIALDIMASFLFACVILDQKSSDRISTSPANKNAMVDAMATIKAVITLIVLAHAGLMTAQYLEHPTRVTGLVKDYSQASMAILITFSLIMPELRKSKFGLLITTILFLGFFCSFSRSVNFLLIIFLGFTFLHARQTDQLSWWLKSSAVILLCFLAVSFYPALISEPAVNRGGLEHISTLNNRVVYWGAAWDAIKQNPLWGYGLGNYEWSGIKTAKPFEYIPSVHNDYLQVWLDLGIFWLVFMVFLQAKFMLKHMPFSFTNLAQLKVPLIKVSEKTFLAWLMLLCVCLYMSINFIVSFLFFQLLIAILICEVLNEED